MVNDDIVDQEQKSLPLGHMYCSPQHMINLNFGANEPSSYIFYNPYIQTKGSLKVGDMFHTKENCVRAIKKYHMEISVDYIVYHTNVTTYKILCHNMLYMFRLTTSNRKRSDYWEICSMGPGYTCIITNPMKNHRKLNS